VDRIADVSEILSPASRRSDYPLAFSDPDNAGPLSDVHLALKLDTVKISET
jgi:hypothetical protein